MSGMRAPFQPDRDQLDLVTILAALSDPTRLGIVVTLAEVGEVSCRNFGEGATKTALSYHYAKLREAGVTWTRIEGTQRFISLRRDDLDAKFPGLLDSIVTNARRAKASEPVP
jgi:DNA-binding transcriptional ArsR family regulator